jgi:hypothetical protein
MAAPLTYEFVCELDLPHTTSYVKRSAPKAEGAASADHVGEVFLGSVFQGLSGDLPRPPGDRPARARRLHHAFRRFLDAVASGAYPLMGSGGKGPLIRPHQLLDACARSPIVRARYSDLVRMSVAALAGLVAGDQAEGELRPDVEPETVAQMALALIIGAQTMGDLGLSLDAAALGLAVEKMLASA